MNDITPSSRPPDLGDEAGLFNVSGGKTACQSSLSRWSLPDESARALYPQPDRSFAFHTDAEAKPWWQVDLGAAYPIETIRIFNREDALQERAQSLQVETSFDGTSWRLVHAGFTVFGGLRSHTPFTCELAGLIQARFVRLSLAEHQPLHLSYIQVLVRSDVAAAVRFKSEFGLSSLDIQPPALRFGELHSAYSPYSSAGVSGDAKVVGLRISHAARFGNYLQQLTNAILIARKCGLAIVQLPDQPLFPVPDEAVRAGLRFIPYSAPTPCNCVLLEGVFFESSAFYPLLGHTLAFGRTAEKEHTEACRTIIWPHMLKRSSFPDTNSDGNLLTVHIRSGYIFNKDSIVDVGYRQPPLPFYKQVVKHARVKSGISQVKLVYEDTGNPVIDTLKTWLSALNLPHQSQSGSLEDDLRSLLDASHLVFGYGTFGYSVARLSKRIRSLYYFEPEIGGRCRYIDTIDKVFSISDKAGQYLVTGHGWTNNFNQRKLMIEYPESKIS